MKTHEVPAAANFVSLRVDRSAILGKPISGHMVLEVSLDGGFSWGGQFVVHSADLAQAPHVAFPLMVGMGFDGTPPIRAGLDTDAVRGVELPPEQGRPRLVRWACSLDLPAAIDFGFPQAAADSENAP